MLALLIFATIVGGCLAVGFIVKDFWNAEASAVRRRLSEEFGKDKDQAQPAATPLLFKKLQESLSATHAKPEAPAATWKERFLEYYDQAKAPCTWRQLLLTGMGLGFVLALALAWFRGPIFALAGAATGLGAPWLWLHCRRRSRREKYLRQLPTVFDLMARVLRTGQSIQQALQAVADTCEDPVAGEFARCQKQLHLGLSNQVTYREMARRSGILEMRLFVLAMLIQGQVGGNLAEVLERLANTIRMRLRLRSQMNTLTAEGRLQGWTLVVLPFLLFGVLMVVNRRYIEVLLEHGQLIFAGLAAMAVGILWIRRIVRLDV